jgi:hypothetical protein
VIDLEEDDPAAATPELARLFPDGEPETAGWTSPRGRHRLFAWDPRLAPGPAVVVLAGGAVELRAGGPGKQVMSVCPPTTGTGTVPREWQSVRSIARLPPRVIDAVTARVGRPGPYLGVPHGSSDRVLDRELLRVKAAKPGTRNATLNRAAFVLGLQVAAGRIAIGEAERLLVTAADECGLPSGEAISTIRRGLSAGVRKAA